MVDTIKAMVGATVTIFQKTAPATSARGDQRAGRLGCARHRHVHPANPDGAANPVVETVMRGETYRGNAFVVDSWLVSAYAP